MIPSRKRYDEPGYEWINAGFRKINIPLERQKPPSFGWFANKLVSVQPLPGPVGLVHYLNAVRNSKSR